MIIIIGISMVSSLSVIDLKKPLNNKGKKGIHAHSNG